MFLYIYTHRHLADILFLTQLTLVAQSLDCFPRTFDRVADCCGLLYCRNPATPLSLCETIDIIGFLSPRHQFLFMVWTSFDHKAHCQTFLLKLFQKKGEHFFRLFQNLFDKNMLLFTSPNYHQIVQYFW